MALYRRLCRTLVDDYPRVYLDSCIVHCVHISPREPSSDHHYTLHTPHTLTAAPTNTHLDRYTINMSLVLPQPAPTAPKNDTCTREHAFHAFDTLYCSLTHAAPISPRFPDDK